MSKFLTTPKSPHSHCSVALLLVLALVANPQMAPELEKPACSEVFLEQALMLRTGKIWISKAAAFWPVKIPPDLDAHDQRRINVLDKEASENTDDFLGDVIADVLARTDLPEAEQAREADRRLKAFQDGLLTREEAWQYLGVKTQGDLEMLDVPVQYVVNSGSKNSLWMERIHNQNHENVQAPPALILHLKADPTAAARPVVVVLSYAMTNVSAAHRDTILQHEIRKATHWSNPKTVAPRVMTALEQGVEVFNDAVDHVHLRAHAIRLFQELPSQPKAESELLQIAKDNPDDFDWIAYAAAISLAHPDAHVRQAAENLLLALAVQDMRPPEPNGDRNASYRASTFTRTLRQVLFCGTLHWGHEAWAGVAVATFKRLYGRDLTYLPYREKIAVGRVVVKALFGIARRYHLLYYFFSVLHSDLYEHRQQNKIAMNGDEREYFQRINRSLPPGKLDELNQLIGDADLNQLLQELEPLLKEYPFHGALHELKAQALHRRNHLEEAAVSAREAVLLSGGQADITRTLISILIDLGNSEEASLELEKLLNQDPDDPQNLIALSKLERLTKDFKGELKSAKDAMGLALHHPGTLRIARSHFLNMAIESEAYEEALPVAMLCTRVYPDDPHGYWSAAVSNFKLGRASDALPHIRQALAFSEGKRNISINESFLEIATAMVEHGEVDTTQLQWMDKLAQSSYDRFVERVSIRNASTEYLIARGKNDRARKLNRHTLKMFPEDQKALELKVKLDPGTPAPTSSPSLQRRSS